MAEHFRVPLYTLKLVQWQSDSEELAVALERTVEICRLSGGMLLVEDAVRMGSAAMSRKFSPNRSR